MGMAASQARYLALVARKSNCEYEGQQINQSRLALSNQSADLFNQMMNLEVPKTPNKSDYTYTTYTFTDGDNEFTIDKWNHLSDAEGEGYNYAVTYHYDTEDNVGYQKYKYDPQIQFSISAPSIYDDPAVEVIKINTALTSLSGLKKEAAAKEQDYLNALSKAKTVSNYTDKDTFKSATATATDERTEYNVTQNGGSTAIYRRYDTLSDTEKQVLEQDIKKLIEYGIFKEQDVGENYSKIYYSRDNSSIALYSGLESLYQQTAQGFSGALTIYPKEKMNNIFAEVQTAYEEYVEAQKAYEKAEEDAYNEYNIPTKIGNTKLKALCKDDLDENMIAAINKIIKQMKEDEIETNITQCFNTVDGTYTIDNYIGGLYTFDQAATTLYTTYYDLYNSIINGTGMNNIDGQKKLPVYGTQDMEVPVEKTSRALIEKEKSGRFKTIRLEDDSLVYDLKAITETDEVAYEDAINEANYQKALYDKKVQDINAMTSIIQRQDQQLELRLKQLDTEQNALSTEIDAVSKVVKDNIEKSFKTFGG